MRHIEFYRRLMPVLLISGVLLLVAGGCRKKTAPPPPKPEPAPATTGNTAREGGGHDNAEIEWVTDWDKAKQTAQQQNKDLLIDFSGSDWCGWCKRLDAEVFKKPEFAAAGKDFVFVLIDFPSDKSKQSDELQAQNKKLAEEFKVKGFPTIFLTGSDGKPYAQTGYQEGGPAAYLEHLEELKKQKTAP